MTTSDYAVYPMPDGTITQDYFEATRAWRRNEQQRISSYYTVLLSGTFSVAPISVATSVSTV